MSAPVKYLMTKNGWDHYTGGFTSKEKVAGWLTIEQVRSRVARLPDSTRWLWDIDAYRKEGPHDHIVGSINAYDFEGFVPEYDEVPQ